MSSKILLEDDAMFGDDNDDEEDVDVDDSPPAANPSVKAEVKDDDDGDDDAAGDDAMDTDDEEVGGGDVPNGAPQPSASGAGAPAVRTVSSAGINNPDSPILLATSIPHASPFPHHNSGPTSDRLRSATSRIASSPTRDAEAWQALITEAGSCYRQLLPSLHKLLDYSAADAPPSAVEEADLIGRKVDWIESIYGALLHHFPHAVSHYVHLVEMLLRLSAVTPDEVEQCGPPSSAMTGGGGVGGGGGTAAHAGTGGSALSNPALCTPDGGVAVTPGGMMMVHSSTVSGGVGADRRKLVDAKLDRIFQVCLGVKLDGSSAIFNDDRGAGDDEDDDADAPLKDGTVIDMERAALSPSSARTVSGGLCPHSVDLWLLYVRKRTWDATRAAAVESPIPVPPPGYLPGQAQQSSVLHQQYEESLRSTYRRRHDIVREAVGAAYEAALERGAGFAANNHLAWRRYVNYVKSWTVSPNYAEAAASMYSYLLSRGGGAGAMDVRATIPPPDPAYEHTTSQRQMSLLRSIYQRGSTHPMTGLDQFWMEYESFERSHSESLGSVLIAEYLPKYQHARSVYLERNRAWNAHELKGGRLAVPPVGCETGGSGGAATGAGGMGLTSRGAGAAAAGLDDDLDAAGTAGVGAAGMDGKPGLSDAELLPQLDEERVLLGRWRRRSGYERTNPERLPSSDHAERVRATYREEVCAFARHPEVWYEWSAWELLQSGGSAGASSSSGGGSSSSALAAPAKAGDWKSGGNAVRAVAVLSLGMESLPDSALLAQAQAEILERHLGVVSGGGTNGQDTSDPKRQGRMGGCIEVLERFVRRSPTTLGFVLLQRLVRRHVGIAAARAVFSRARRTLRVKEEDMSYGEKDGNATSADAEKKADDVVGQTAGAKDGADIAADESQPRMVTNRLKSSVGVLAPQSAETTKAIVDAGYITWHLYAAHATIEHRLCKNPKVAARIYELGLRKHRTFLSNPPYVLHYANLLLELNDEENLRSLLMRAVAACEEEEAITANSNDTSAVAKRREMQRPLWDMMLKFESVLSSRGGNNSSNTPSDILSIEARRRRALYGPSNEDVVLGGEGPPDDDEDRTLGTGMHKSSLNEQLIRAEGYDVASRIANGMGRLVDALTVTGAIGNGESTTISLDFAAAASASLAAGGTSSDVWEDECAGGPSDISYMKRLQFQRESRTRTTAAAFGLGAQQSGTSTGKILSARDRSAGAGSANAAVQQAALLQTCPEWLRPLMLLLPPVPRFGRAGTIKPPPHLTELALSSLRSNPLPDRPESNGKADASKKRERGVNDGGDSSDEDSDENGGGYSNQFRSRQRSRLAATVN